MVTVVVMVARVCSRSNDGSRDSGSSGGCDGSKVEKVYEDRVGMVQRVLLVSNSKMVVVL